MSHMLKIDHAIEGLWILVEQAEDKHLLFQHISQLRTLAHNIQHRLERNDVRKVVIESNSDLERGEDE